MPSKKAPASLASRIVADLRAAYKDDLAATTLADGGRAVVKEVCPTGSTVLDRHVLGVGGLAWGRIYELAGPESAGKSTLACRVMAMAQADGAQPVLSDKENKFHAGWAAVHGLDLANTVEFNPPHVEAYHEGVKSLLAKHGRKTRLLFVLDSVAALPPKAYMDGDLEDSEMPGAMAKAWSRGLRDLSPLVLERQAILLLLNQMRQKIGVMYGNPDDTPAGNAIKHYATARLMVSHGKSIDGQGAGAAKVGRYMKVRTIKNNLVRPHLSADLKMLYETGFDDAWSIVNFAKETGCLEKSKDVRALPEALKNLGWAEAPGEAE